MIVIGYSGTQKGMTRAQVDACERVVVSLLFVSCSVPSLEAHHGDCIGGDRQFHMIARYYGAIMHVHPCSIESKRAHCSGDVTYPVRPPLERDEDIVKPASFVIVAPSQGVMVQRSGTWTTYRRAVDARKPIALLMPGGQIVQAGAPWPAWFKIEEITPHTRSAPLGPIAPVISSVDGEPK